MHPDYSSWYRCFHFFFYSISSFSRAELSRWFWFLSRVLILLKINRLSPSLCILITLFLSIYTHTRTRTFWDVLSTAASRFHLFSRICWFYLFYLLFSMGFEMIWLAWRLLTGTFVIWVLAVEFSFTWGLKSRVFCLDSFSEEKKKNEMV